MSQHSLTDQYSVRIFSFYILRCLQKNLSAPASVWSKTTKNTGGVGEAGADPSNL